MRLMIDFSQIFGESPRRLQPQGLRPPCAYDRLYLNTQQLHKVIVSVHTRLFPRFAPLQLWFRIFQPRVFSRPTQLPQR